MATEKTATDTIREQWMAEKLTMKNRPLKRPLFCPICGAKLLSDVKNNGQFPEIHTLPDHFPATDVNLCSAVVVTVTLDFTECSKCKCKMSKHPSGLCSSCFCLQHTFRKS